MVGKTAVQMADSMVEQRDDLTAEKKAVQTDETWAVLSADTRV